MRQLETLFQTALAFCALSSYLVPNITNDNDSDVEYKTNLLFLAVLADPRAWVQEARRYAMLFDDD